MADAALEFLLNSLKELLLHYAHLIKEAKTEFDTLYKNLDLLKSILKDATKTRHKNELPRTILRQIREVIYKAEDAIDDYVLQAAGSSSKTKNWLPTMFQSGSIPTAETILSVSEEVRNVYKTAMDNLSVLMDGDDNGIEQKKQKRPSVLHKVVGFDDKAEEIIGWLYEETGYLDVISITGMPGLGKTTLARKVLYDERHLDKFPTRIWIDVSPVFTLKAICLNILKGIKKFPPENSISDDAELASITSSYLETEQFLIVMDDVWTTEDWNKIRTVLPTNNKASKVLITSRHSDVARHANRHRQAHELQKLNEDDSWLLLQYQVFGKPDSCPPILESHGKDIARLCHGLPLAIVVIGGILLSKTSVNDMNANKREWGNVSNNVPTYSATQMMHEIIALSYQNLDYHLRPCFLYLGIFPQGSEISVRKLISMWIAEGFIQPKGTIGLDETARNYLSDLIRRNLLTVNKSTHDGLVKTCYIHDMLRQFCKDEAAIETEYFLKEIEIASEENYQGQHEAEFPFRRLCIHSNVLEFISSERAGPRVRSFICFADKDVNLPKKTSSAIPRGFKLVRILDVKPIKFHKIPADLYRMIHLRFVVLSFTAASLPADFAKLWNIETLIVNTTSRTLDIKADIWKMKQLQHLKTNASATLPKPGKKGKEGKSFQTLSTVSLQSCSKEFFAKAQNLKKLGIRGRLSQLLEGKIASFGSMEKLNCLEKLKLINNPCNSPSQGLPSLPPHYQFPKSLKSLTLSKTFLGWHHMSTLGLIESLVILKLKHKAFMGQSWVTRDANFSKLEVLHIADTDLEYWVASSYYFPRLKFLELHQCEQLKVIPFDLANVPDLQLLDLYKSELAVTSAQKIYKEKQSNGAGDFKLSIFPPVPQPN